MSLIANETDNVGTQAMKEPYIGANLVKGKMQWGMVDEGSRLPASLFLSSQPAYLKGKKWQNTLGCHQKWKDHQSPFV